MPNPKVDLKNRHLALLLAWMVPGLGHFYQGRIGKGILYSTSILSLFIVGLAMGEWKIVYWRWVNPLVDTEAFCFYYLGQFWAGLLALPALIQSTLQYKDHAPILWGFMAKPEQKELFRLYQPHGKFIEIGILYTTVAGLLNILAMYDAFEGPAHAETDDQPAPAKDPKVKSRDVEVGGLGMIIYLTLLPLVAAISLVYSASRHESRSKIGRQALRLGGAITGILVLTMLILLLINTQV